MDFIKQLDLWDRELMLLMNYDGGLWSDCFWFAYSYKWTWIASAVSILVVFFLLYRHHWRKLLLLILITVLVVTLCDQITSGIFKPWVQRLRPSRDPLLQDLLFYVNDYRGGRYGFMSSHAANSFGMAMWLSCLFRNRTFRCCIFVWAILNSYSRIYLGVHYPGDIICGAAVGLLCGWFCYWLYSRLCRTSWIADHEPPRPLHPGLARIRTRRYTHIMTYTLLLTVLALDIYACFCACS